MRIGAIGSCVTRDLWPFRVDVSNLLFFGRVSLASVASKPLEADLSGLELASAWQRRAVEADVRKTILAELEAFAPSVLILDLVNERYDLLQIGDSIITRSQEFVAGGGERQPWAQVARRISRLSDEAEELWARGVVALRGKLRESPALRSVRLVIHRAPWATSYCRGPKLSEPLLGLAPLQTVTTDADVDAATYAALLERLYGRLAELLPEAEQIAVDRRFCVASDVHQWGRGPFHYVQDYYEEFRREAAARAIELFTPAARSSEAFRSRC